MRRTACRPGSRSSAAPTAMPMCSRRASLMRPRSAVGTTRPRQGPTSENPGGNEMADNDLCYMTATEALALFKAKKLSPVELMKAVIARAEKVQPKLKPYTYMHFDEALDLAKKAEAKYAKGGRTGALEGLPIAIKDESYIAGKPTSFGSLITKDTVPEKSSVNNERIMNAGAIVLGRTATPEFSCASVTHSKAWGVTRNPWNP